MLRILRMLTDLGFCRKICCMHKRTYRRYHFGDDRDDSGERRRLRGDARQYRCNVSGGVGGVHQPMHWLHVQLSLLLQGRRYF